MRAVLAHKGSATNRANSSDRGLKTPQRSLAVVKLTGAPPGARLQPQRNINGAANQVNSTLLLGRLPQFNVVMHLNFRKAARMTCGRCRTRVTRERRPAPCGR